MPKLAASVAMMFNEWDLLDRFEHAARVGFWGVENPIALRRVEGGHRRPSAPARPHGHAHERLARRRRVARARGRLSGRHHAGPGVRGGGRLSPAPLPGGPHRRSEGRGDLCRQSQVGIRAGAAARSAPCFSSR